MQMIRSMAKVFAYSKAPKTTFTLLHPRQALKLRTVKKELRSSQAPRIAAIGAAVLALPLGMALGRMTSGRRENAA
jgi:hypothetical protein